MFSFLCAPVLECRGGLSSSVWQLCEYILLFIWYLVNINSQASIKNDQLLLHVATKVKTLAALILSHFITHGLNYINYWAYYYLCQWYLTQISPCVSNCFLCLCLSSQDIACYVIDNNGFVLISKQRNDVSSHTLTHTDTEKMCFLDFIVFDLIVSELLLLIISASTEQGKKHAYEKVQLYYSEIH